MGFKFEQFVKETELKERSKIKNLLRRKGKNAVYEKLKTEKRKQVEELKSLRKEDLISEEEYERVKKIYVKMYDTKIKKYSKWIEDFEEEMKEEK